MALFDTLPPGMKVPEGMEAGTDLSSIGEESMFTGLGIGRPAEPVSLPKEAGKAIVRGIGGVGEMGAHLVKLAGAEETGKSIEEASASLSEKYAMHPELQKSFAARGILGGLESMPASVAAGVPGAIVGAKLGAAGGSAVAPGLGTILGGIGGGVLGYALSGASLMGLSEYQNYLDEYEKEFGKTPDSSVKASAALSGLAEGGFEGLSDLIGGAVVFKPVLASGAHAIRDIIRAPFKKGAKEFLKDYGKIAATETGTEMATAAGEAYARQQQGMETPGIGEAVKESIIPALTMSTLFMGGGTLIQKHKMDRLEKSLEDPTVTPEDRVRAAVDVDQLIQASNIDPATGKLTDFGTQMSQAWKDYALQSIKNGQGIDLDKVLDPQSLQIEAGLAQDPAAKAILDESTAAVKAANIDKVPVTAEKSLAKEPAVVTPAAPPVAPAAPAVTPVTEATPAPVAPVISPAEAAVAVPEKTKKKKGTKTPAKKKTVEVAPEKAPEKVAEAAPEVAPVITPEVVKEEAKDIRAGIPPVFVGMSDKNLKEFREANPTNEMANKEASIREAEAKTAKAAPVEPAPKPVVETAPAVVPEPAVTPTKVKTAAQGKELIAKKKAGKVPVTTPKPVAEEVIEKKPPAGAYEANVRMVKSFPNAKDITKIPTKEEYDTAYKTVRASANEQDLTASDVMRHLLFAKNPEAFPEDQNITIVGKIKKAIAAVPATHKVTTAVTAKKVIAEKKAAPVAKKAQPEAKPPVSSPKVQALIDKVSAVQKAVNEREKIIAVKEKAGESAVSFHKSQEAQKKELNRLKRELTAATAEEMKAKAAPVTENEDLNVLNDSLKILNNDLKKARKDHDEAVRLERPKNQIKILAQTVEDIKQDISDTQEEINKLSEPKLTRAPEEAKGMSVGYVMSVVDKIKGKMVNPPPIEVIPSMDTLLKSGTPEGKALKVYMEEKKMLDENGEDHRSLGLVWGGKMYIIAENHSSEEEVLRTYAHELTHKGLGAFFERVKAPGMGSIRLKYNILMDKIWQAHKKEVENIVATTHEQYDLNVLVDRRKACEEWLCNQTYDAQSKWYDRLVAIFNDILRVIGIDTKLTDAEVRTILKDSFGQFGAEAKEPMFRLTKGPNVSPERMMARYIDPKGLEQRTKRREKREEGVGAPLNDRIVLKKGDYEFVVGLPTFDDWITRAKNTLGEDGIEKSRVWYQELTETLDPIYGKDTGKIMVAWLLSQQNVSVSGGFGNVLRALDIVNGKQEIKKPGLNADALIAVLSGQQVKKGVGAKLMDFFDGAMGKEWRTWYKDNPVARHPAPIDVWAFRDIGFVDKAWMKEFIIPKFGEKAAKAIEVDKMSRTEAQYEYGIDYYNDLADYMNYNNINGQDWTAEQVQAVGWIATQQISGRKPEFIRDMIDKNVRRISIGLGPGGNTNLENKLAGAEIPVEVARKEVERIADLAGVKIIDTIEGVGGWMTSLEGSIQVYALASPEAVADFRDMIGYAFQQTEMVYSRALQSGDRSSLNLLSPEFKDTATAQKFFVEFLKHVPRIPETKKAEKERLKDRPGEPAPDILMVEGFSQIKVDGVPGIQFIKRTGKWNDKQIDALKDAINKASVLTNIEIIDTLHHNIEAEWIKNDWKENPNGEAYLNSLGDRGRLQEVTELQRRYLPSRIDIAGDGRIKWGGRAPSFARRAEPAGRSRAAGQRAERKGATRSSGQELIDQGTHYSREQRTSLDSKYYGTGLADAASRRLPSDPKSPLRQRIHFYYDPGTGMPRAEVGVGAYAHNADLSQYKIYNLTSGVIKVDRVEGEHVLNTFEKAIMKAGFDGFSSPDYGVVVLIGKRKVDVQPAEPQFSRKEDARYLELAKDPEKNKAELQKMVDDAAKAAGKPTSERVTIVRGIIDRFLNRIDASDADAIYLVGSRAGNVNEAYPERKGIPNEESDWDFVVVGEDFNGVEDEKLEILENGGNIFGISLDSPRVGRNESNDIIFDSQRPKQGLLIYDYKKDTSITDPVTKDDYPNTESSRSKTANLFGGREIPAMEKSVVPSISQSQILDPIVKAIPVDVMDVLGSTERASEVLLHDPSVLVSAFTVNENRLVGLPAVARFRDEVMGVVAGIRAELSSLTNTTPLNRKMFSAMNALQNNLVTMLRDLSSKSIGSMGDIPQLTLSKDATPLGGDVAGVGTEPSTTSRKDARLYQKLDSADFTEAFNFHSKLSRTEGGISQVKRVIPLSERFNPETPDIRFSRRGEEPRPIGAITEQIQKEFGVNKITSRVLEKLAERAGYIVESLGARPITRKDGSTYVPYAVNYGARVKGAKGFATVGPAREVSEFLESEIIDKEINESSPNFQRKAQTNTPEFSRKEANLHAEALKYDTPEKFIKDHYKKLNEVAQEQRGEPESKMLRLSGSDRDYNWQPSQLYAWAAEHVGDLTHRIFQKPELYEGKAGAKEKIDKTIDKLKNPFLFEREVSEQIVRNYDFNRSKGRYQDQTLEEFRNEFLRRSQDYAEAHKKLPVYNEVGQLAKDAAVAVGEWRFKDAATALEKLKDLYEKGDWEELVTNKKALTETWNRAHEGIKFSRKAKTNTPEFKKWFGKSVVKDKNGDPLVVYHGTNKNISDFMVPAFFSNDPDVASVATRKGWSGRETGEGGQVYPSYLSIQKPADLYEDKVASGIAIKAAGKGENYFEDGGEAWELLTGETGDKVIRVLSANGYDGATFEGDPIELFAAGFKQARTYVAFSPTQIKSATGNVGTFDETNPDIRFRRAPANAAPASVPPGSNATWNASGPTPMKTFFYNMIDKQIDLRETIKDIEKFAGTIADAVNASLRETLYSGRVAKLDADFLDYKLRPIYSELAKRNIDITDFEEYLWFRHAKEANAYVRTIADDNGNIIGMQDKGSGKTDQETDDYFAALNPAKQAAYEALAEKVDVLTKENAQLMVDYQLESQDTVDKWMSKYQHYVPLFREHIEDARIGTGSGLTVTGSVTRRRKGSEKPVVDVIANIAMQRERIIASGEKNKIATAIYALAKKFPNEDFWKVVKPPMRRTIDVSTKQPVWVPDPNYKKKDNVVMSRQLVNGKIVERGVEFNMEGETPRRMAASLRNIDMDTLGVVLGTSARVTRFIASMNTQWNPIFGVTNFVRDVGTAMFNLTTTPIAGRQREVMTHAIPAIKGIWEAVRAQREGRTPTSEWGKLFNEFQLMGGQTGYRDLFKTSGERSARIDKEMRLMMAGGVVKAGLSLKGLVEDYNSSMENAIRLASYKTGIDRGMSKEQAAAMAKSLTVNFNRKGQIATQAGALYAFFNASAQGAAKVYETLTGPSGKKVIFGGVMFGVLQAAMLAAAGMKDDEPPEFVQEKNFIIPTGGGKYITIPMPLGFNVLPNIGRMSAQFAMGGFKDPFTKMANLFGVILDGFNPLGASKTLLQTISPTPIDPLVALAENKDWTGKPIYREDFSSLHPTPGFTRTKDTATWGAKGLAWGLNMLTGGTRATPGFLSPTPDMIDYLTGQAMGGVGREFGKVQQVAQSAVTGEELPAYKIPLASRFYGTVTGEANEGMRYYNNLKLMNRHEDEIKDLVKHREPIKEYLADNPEAKLWHYSNSMESTINKLKKRKSELIARDADPRTIKAIDSLMKSHMKRFNERVEAAKG